MDSEKDAASQTNAIRGIIFVHLRQREMEFKDTGMIGMADALIESIEVGNTPDVSHALFQYDYSFIYCR